MTAYVLAASLPPWLPATAVLVLILGSFLLYWVCKRRWPAAAHRIREFFRKETGVIICVLGVLILPIGLLGFVYRKHGEESIWEALYETAQLYFLNVQSDELTESWPLIPAMVLAVLLAALVAGKAIILLFHDSYARRRLASSSDHVVICGLGQIGLQLVVDKLTPGSNARVVVVEKDPGNPDLERARSLGAMVVTGDASTPQTLQDARVTEASEIFVVSGDDGLNIEIAAEICELLGPTRAASLYVHIVDTNLATTLRPNASRLHQKKNVKVEIFSVPRTAATRLVTTQLWPYAPKGPEDVAHFAILGFGAMGQALALQLAQLGSFPNRKRSRFTIAGRDIQSSAGGFLARFGRFTSWTAKRLGVRGFSPSRDSWDDNSQPLPPHLHIPHLEATQYVCNAEFKELPATLCDEQFAIHLADRFREPHVKPAVFICGEHDRQNFDSAVQLREQLTHHGMADVPIFVWLPRQPALARALDADGRLHPFGECQSSASYSEITSPARETIGEKIHDDYQRQRADGQRRKGKTPDALVRWSDEKDPLRESSRIAADHVAIKLAALGYKLARENDPVSANDPAVEQLSASSHEMEMLGEMEHYRFVSERLLSGWCYTPPVPDQTDEEKAADRQLKLNSTLVSWQDLRKRTGGAREVAKDFDQVRTVLAECQKDKFRLVRLKTTEPSRQMTGQGPGRRSSTAATRLDSPSCSGKIVHTRLVLVSQEDLTKLADEFETRGEGHMDAVPREEGRWHATLAVSHVEPEASISAKLAIVESLPTALRAVWDGCERRDVEIGFDGSEDSTRLDRTLSTGLLLRMAACRMGLRVAVAPL